MPSSQSHFDERFDENIGRKPLARLPLGGIGMDPDEQMQFKRCDSSAS